MKRAGIPSIPGIRLMLVLALGIGVAACDSVSNTMDQASPEVQGATANRLAGELRLAARQVEALAPALSRVDDREPGALWRAAAALQQTLNADQKEQLLARAQRPGAGDRPMTGRRQRGGLRDSSALSALTDEQRAAVREAMEAHHTAMQTLMQQRKAGDIDEAAFREQARVLRDALSATLAPILPEGMRPPAGAMRPEGPRGARSGDGPRLDPAMREEATAAMVEALGLTPEQQEQLAALRETQRKEMEALRASHAAGDRDAAREAFDALRDRHRTAVDGIYTDAQRETIALHRALLFEARPDAGPRAAHRRGKGR
ncbi:MAG: Spy/CpxP family protein refolding chaperone [Rhodothermales bacterium]